jgi:alpha-beta hydrolase superfamily lysophospholipase
MIKSTNGIELFTKESIVKNAEASLMLVHGLGEYCERYEHVIKAFNEIGVNVYTFDLRGHGHSTGERAFITNLDEYREDIENIYRSIPKDLPFFVLGHSLGGLIVTHFLLFNKRNDVQGVILSGSALEAGEDVTPLKQKIIRLLAKVSPKIKTVKLNPNDLSRSKETVEAYKNDPFIYHDGGKAGLAVALLDGIALQKKRFNQFDYPVLIMHGGADKITNPEGSKSLYEQSKSTDKTLKIWEGAFHEIFNEINQEQIIDYTTVWLKNRI